MNLASYKISVKTELEKSDVLDRQVKRKVSITDEDVERYYKLNSKNYRTNERARIRHILLTLSEKAPAEQVNAVSAKAQGVVQKNCRRRRLCRRRAGVFRRRWARRWRRNRLGE